MKKIVKYCLVATLGFGVVACGSNEPKAEVEAEESHEGHDHSGEEGMTGSMVVDSEQSSLNWEGGILNIGDEFVKSHNGTIVIKDGQLEMENGEITAGKFIVDMTTITPLDDNYQPEEGKSKEKLVGHLSSEDFFSIEEYPEAIFVINESKDGVVTGEMTIRGTTNNEEIKDVMITTVDGVTTVSGMMTIDRQKYNVAFDLGAQDMFLSDNINLTFAVVLN
jgi:polyisoprenoid-binding protein YceI